MRLLLETSGYFKGKSQKLKDDRGSVLVVVLLLLLVVSIVVPIMVMQTNNEIKQTSANEQGKEAFYIAEAGLEHTKSIVRDQDFNKALAGEDGDKVLVADNGQFPSVGTIENFKGSNYTKVNFNDGKYYTRITDNRDDGDIWRDSDNIILIDAIGVSSEGMSEHLEAKVRKINLDIPEIPGTISLVSDTARMDPQGTDFLVSGQGTTHGSLGPEIDTGCSTINDVATTASELQIGTYGNSSETVDLSSFDWSALQEVQTAEDLMNFLQSLWDYWTAAKTATTSADLNDVTGVDTLSTQNPSMSSTDIQQLRERILSVPDIQILPSEMTTGILGSESEPGVFHANGSFVGGGDLMGNGILVVDNILAIKEDFQWDGLIIVGGCQECQGRFYNGSGSPEVYGAMIIASSGSNSAAIKFDGDGKIYHSCAALENLKKITKDTFKTISWKKLN